MTHKAKPSPGRALIAATLATSLALTPVAATPARAGSQDNTGAIAAFTLFGLLTAGLLANSLAHQPNRYDPPRGGQRPPLGTRKHLPGECRFQVRHGQDRGTWYGSRCLKRNFDYWAYLPQRCEEHIDRPGRPDRTGYRARCLAQFGYRAD